MAYTISINEVQRAILEEALEAYNARPQASRPTPADEEAVILQQMFQSLPSDEAECPGALHGFCV